IAYRFSAKTKAIILRNELSRTEAFESFATEDMISKEQELVNQMYDLQEQLFLEGVDQDTILKKYTETQRELDNFLSNLEHNAPAYFQNKFVFIAPLTRKAIASSLPSDVAIIEYFFTEDEIISFWITKDHFFDLSISCTPQMMADISSYVNQCRDASKTISSEQGYRIYQQLLEKGLKRIGPTIKRLNIIPDGILHTLPFEALTISEQKVPKYLIQSYSISHSYSTDLLFKNEEYSYDLPYVGFSSKYTTDLSQKLKNKKLLFGDENLPQLVLAKNEIERSTALFSGKKFLDQHANIDNFFKASSDAEIIHLSLHGLVDFDDPLRSSIVFDDHKEEFVLSAADLYTHKINSELVILSACHSANGKIYLSEGVQGMSKAFLLSGAHSILSSLWNASEASSLQIIPTFLDNIKSGSSKDQALQQAKLNYLQNTRPSQKHPSYWANFVLIGDISTHPPTPFPIGWIALGILILVISVGMFFLRKKVFKNFFSVP
ncbi:MAG: CHAT domain-containing protein, partial [Bacteroidota bacterium]